MTSFMDQPKVPHHFFAVPLHFGGALAKTWGAPEKFFRHFAPRQKCPTNFKIAPAPLLAVLGGKI
jgi:hypothetical protein